MEDLLISLKIFIRNNIQRHLYKSVTKGIANAIHFQKTQNKQEI